MWHCLLCLWCGFSLRSAVSCQCAQCVAPFFVVVVIVWRLVLLKHELALCTAGRCLQLCLPCGCLVGRGRYVLRGCSRHHVLGLPRAVSESTTALLKASATTKKKNRSSRRAGARAGAGGATAAAADDADDE